MAGLKCGRRLHLDWDQLMTMQTRQRKLTRHIQCHSVKKTSFLMSLIDQPWREKCYSKAPLLSLNRNGILLMVYSERPHEKKVTAVNNLNLPSLQMVKNESGSTFIHMLITASVLKVLLKNLQTSLTMRMVMMPEMEKWVAALRVFYNKKER